MSYFSSVPLWSCHFAWKLNLNINFLSFLTLFCVFVLYKNEMRLHQLASLIYLCNVEYYFYHAMASTCSLIGLFCGNYLNIDLLSSRSTFTWQDLSYCTETSFKTLENKHKPLVFKDLRKIWEKHNPNLPWEKGYYNESNTLLLDDSPYKALLNPVNNTN